MDAGAGVICYATQAQFLLHGGLLNRLQGAIRQRGGTRQRLNAVQNWSHPPKWVNCSKVLVVGKGEPSNGSPSLAAVDQHASGCEYQFAKGIDFRRLNPHSLWAQRIFRTKSTIRKISAQAQFRCGFHQKLLLAEQHPP